jgi:hypothetical protein
MPERRNRELDILLNIFFERRASLDASESKKYSGGIQHHRFNKKTKTE